MNKTVVEIVIIGDGYAVRSRTEYLWGLFKSEYGYHPPVLNPSFENVLFIKSYVLNNGFFSSLNDANELYAQLLGLLKSKPVNPTIIKSSKENT